MNTGTTKRSVSPSVLRSIILRGNARAPRWASAAYQHTATEQQGCALNSATESGTAHGVQQNGEGTPTCGTCPTTILRLIISHFCTRNCKITRRRKQLADRYVASVAVLHREQFGFSASTQSHARHWSTGGKRLSPVTGYRLQQHIIRRSVWHRAWLNLTRNSIQKHKQASPKA